MEKKTKRTTTLFREGFIRGLVAKKAEATTLFGSGLGFGPEFGECVGSRV